MKAKALLYAPSWPTADHCIAVESGRGPSLWDLETTPQFCLGSQTNNVNQPGETMSAPINDRPAYLFARLSDLILSAGTLQSASEIPKDRKNKSMSIQHQSL